MQGNQDLNPNPPVKGTEGSREAIGIPSPKALNFGKLGTLGRLIFLLGMQGLQGSNVEGLGFGVWRHILRASKPFGVGWVF